MKTENLSALLMLGVMSSCSGTEKKEVEKFPNVVFILADDLGYGDISCYGQEKYCTPNIDALALQGMKFNQFYAGCTVSAPSRCSLMTGLHTGHTQVRGNKELDGEGQLPMADGTYTLARMFKEKGYVTGAFGKWGLGYPGSEGDPNKQGFDEFFGYNCQRQAHRYYPTHLWHNQEKVLFVKPLTYMNNSGNAVGEFVRYFNIDMKDILVIQDDLDLNVGDYKLKCHSSSGEHNDIKSIINSLGNQDFPRLKVGIGSVKKDQVIDYVLGKFSKIELETLNNEFITFGKIIESFINAGIDKTMNVYNTK